MRLLSHHPLLFVYITSEIQLSSLLITKIFIDAEKSLIQNKIAAPTEKERANLPTSAAFGAGTSKLHGDNSENFSCCLQ
jgi:hypothetical protein